MILIDLKNKMEQTLYEVCVKDINSINKELINENVFSYAIYCDSGFENFGGTACTREAIQNHVGKTGDASYIYAETFAAEWNYVNNHYEFFLEINALNKNILDAEFDGELTGIYEENDFDGSDDTQYLNFYVNLIIDTLKKLKTSCFNSPPFEKDILLGLQFGDPSENERRLIIDVSEKVNSPEWHKKMLKAYSS